MRERGSAVQQGRAPTPAAAGSGAAQAATRRVESLALLGGARELLIDHHGETYHLRLTRNDKLILTK